MAAERKSVSERLRRAAGSCEDCGAYVMNRMDRERHERWHKQLEYDYRAVAAYLAGTADERQNARLEELVGRPEAELS